MNAAQTRLAAAILANLRAGVCSARVMQQKVAEYRRNAERDFSIAATCRRDPRSVEVAANFDKSAATALRNAEATEFALVQFNAAA